MMRVCWEAYSWQKLRWLKECGPFSCVDHMLTLKDTVKTEIPNGSHTALFGKVHAWVIGCCIMYKANIQQLKTTTISFLTTAVGQHLDMASWVLRLRVFSKAERKVLAVSVVLSRPQWREMGCQASSHAVGRLPHTDRWLYTQFLASPESCSLCGSWLPPEQRRKKLLPYSIPQKWVNTLRPHSRRGDYTRTSIMIIRRQDHGLIP